MKPPSKKCENWPKCAFFGVFDGHGGYSCADFLRDNLHQFIIRDPEFPDNPKQAIVNGFKNAESYFLEAVEKFSNGNINMLDKSGSCAITSLFVGKQSLFSHPQMTWCTLRMWVTVVHSCLAMEAITTSCSLGTISPTMTWSKNESLRPAAGSISKHILDVSKRNRT